MIFDLTQLVAARARAVRGRRIFLATLAVIFVGVAVVGLLLLLSAPAGSGPSRTIGPALLVVFGVLIAGEAWYVSRSFRAAPSRLTVTDQHAIFEDEERRVSLRLDWEDPRLRFRLYDLSALPAIHKSAQSRTVEFTIEGQGGLRAPIPRLAYEAIQLQVARHGLRAVRRDLPGRRGGTIQMTLVVGRT